LEERRFADRWRCLPRRGDDAGGKYLISIPNPNIGSVQVDTHLVPSRATWPRQPTSRRPT
jgi:hypothetical protein